MLSNKQNISCKVLYDRHFKCTCQTCLAVFDVKVMSNTFFLRYITLTIEFEQLFKLIDAKFKHRVCLFICSRINIKSGLLLFLFKTKQ